jgi:hypothetical protein
MEHPLFQRAYDLIDRSGLERIAPVLKGSLAFAITLESTPAPGYEFPPESSRLGGTPDLPAGLAWPTWNGVPMLFLARINLSEVATYDLEHRLPASGWLDFFYQSQGCKEGNKFNGLAYTDPWEFGSWKVVYFDGSPADLRATPAPDSLAQARPRLSPCALTFRQAVTLPQVDSLLFATLDLGDEEFARYETLLEAFEALRYQPDEVWHHHQLLGYPVISLGDMELSCHLASIQMPDSVYDRLDAVAQAAIQRDALVWTHLFQIRPDEYAKVSCGEDGSLAFWIKQSDLEQRRFDGCWASCDSL